jgi:hypothetical protein
MTRCFGSGIEPEYRLGYRFIGTIDGQLEPVFDCFSLCLGHAPNATVLDSIVRSLVYHIDIVV